MRAFLDELKAAVTGLGRAPGFLALATGVLGLGLGAVIFMYGVADTLMLKPPPYPHADRIYTIATLDGQTPGDYDQALLPRDALTPRYHSQLVVPVPFTQPSPSRRIALAYRRSFPRPEAIAAIRDSVARCRAKAVTPAPSRAKATRR